MLLYKFKVRSLPKLKIDKGIVSKAKFPVIIKDSKDFLYLVSPYTQFEREESTELKQLVKFVVATRDDIKTNRTILNTLGIDIAASHADDLSGSLVMAFAELKKGNVASIKMLMDSYSSVGETQLKIKKLITEIKDIDIENGEAERKEGSTQNIINFVGTPAELLANLKTN